jgi:2-deoxy-D-gluconate 3-dehydrogenase
LIEKFSLKHKTAIVTGGNRGLGRTIALALAEAGADIVIVGRNEERNQQVVNEIAKLGTKSICFSTDLRKIKSIDESIRN